MEQDKIKKINVEANDYPQMLKEIYLPPKILYYQGKMLSEDINAVAIVGSRKCSLYGLQVAEKLAYELTEKGITIVSGMARGIDSAAHRGALKAGGRTIAVMGSGFNHIYPRESEQLAREIARNGAVVTEYPFDMKPLKMNFPKRNRIISGMSKGVIVVEAAIKSGAMITAGFALDQGREVFAVPGRIDTSVSGGTNRLLQNGAKLVTNVEDIVEELKISLTQKKIYKGNGEQDVSGVGEEELTILSILRKEPGMHIDNISDRVKQSPNVLAKTLLKLETSGKIRSLAGKRYQLIRGR